MWKVNTNFDGINQYAKTRSSPNKHYGHSIQVTDFKQPMPTAVSEYS